jgi:hypothetical protein
MHFEQSKTPEVISLARNSQESCQGVGLPWLLILSDYSWELSLRFLNSMHSTSKVNAFLKQMLIGNASSEYFA